MCSAISCSSSAEYEIFLPCPGELYLGVSATELDFIHFFIVATGTLKRFEARFNEYCSAKATMSSCVGPAVEEGDIERGGSVSRSPVSMAVSPPLPAPSPAPCCCVADQSWPASCCASSVCVGSLLSRESVPVVTSA